MNGTAEEGGGEQQQEGPQYIISRVCMMHKEMAAAVENA
jgi:hypothetical protein